MTSKEELLHYIKKHNVLTLSYIKKNLWMHWNCFNDLHKDIKELNIENKIVITSLSNEIYLSLHK